MLGVTFGDKHSLRDLKLILQTVSMPMPAPKTIMVSVPGTDGSLDLTGYYGDTRFENRTITMVLADIDNYYKRYVNQSIVAQALHGQSMRIVFDEDPEYYYQGRVIASNWAMNGYTRTVTIVCDCEPYKYLINEGGDAWKWNPFSFVNGVIREYGDIDIDGETSIDIVGGWKAVHPTVSVTAPMQVRLDNGAWYSVPKGISKLYNITITRGEHTITFKGTGKAALNIQIGVF